MPFLEVTNEDSDQRRKATPPDLLDLSNHYFDRNQQILGHQMPHQRLGGEVNHSFTPHNRISESSHASRVTSRPPDFMALRPNTTDLQMTSTLSAASSEPNFLRLSSVTSELNKPLKLDPIHHKSSLEETRIKIGGRKKSRLHHSVNFSSQGWRKALEPIGVGGDHGDTEEVKGGLAPRVTLRKDTYTVEQPRIGLPKAGSMGSLIMEEQGSMSPTS